MVNKVLDAVTKQLGQTFGSSYKYYVEDVKQNLTEPCFTIDMLEPRERSRSAVLYYRTMPLVIHYFNDKQPTLKKDSYAMAERIQEAIEYLPFEGTLLRGENMSWQITDGVLQFFITYRFTTVRVGEQYPNMETLDQKF